MVQKYSLDSSDRIVNTSIVGFGFAVVIVQDGIDKCRGCSGSKNVL